MKTAILAYIAVTVGLPAWGQLQGLRDAGGIGPAGDATASAFTLLDQSGQSRTLESLMGPQGLVLVFFRSADW
jgi:hypothetical protein